MMPIRPDREYRTMPVMSPATEKRIDSDYYVEGYATTFNEPYLLWQEEGYIFREQVDRNAFDNADLSDVIFLRNHEGKCLARNRMKQGVAPTLILEPRDEGLFTAADLGLTVEGRNEYEAIANGLVYQMSFAFTVRKDSIVKTGENEYLRTILEINKVYDVSSVDVPANPATSIDIATRSKLEGVIERDRQELLEAAKREAQIKRIKLLSEV